MRGNCRWGSVAQGSNPSNLLENCARESCGFKLSHATLCALHNNLDASNTYPSQYIHTILNLKPAIVVKSTIHDTESSHVAVHMQATINIKVNNTAMVLNNVKEGSNVEVDMTPTAQQAPAAAAVRPDSVPR